MGSRHKIKTAFSANQEASLASAISSFHSRLAAIDRYPLSNEEFLTMFVKEELREPWAKVAEHFHQHGVNCEFSIVLKRANNPESYHLCLDVQEMNFLPLQQFKVLNVSEEFGAWLERRIELGFKFGRALKVLSMLNGACSSPRQVRYYWPIVMSLAQEAGFSSRDMEPLAEPDGRRAPPLDVALRAACQDTAALLTAASLVEPRKREPFPMEITLNNWRNHQTVREDGLGSYPIHVVA